MEKTKQALESGKTYLGIELGSTRIKAVLVDEQHKPIAAGSYEWENKLVDKVWIYELEDVWLGLRRCYADLLSQIRRRYGVTPKTYGAIGISAMMHGYLVLDKQDRQLAPFCTWRNTFTEAASGELTEHFHFNIPQRWSVAHLYHAILNGEPHVRDIALMTTLAGYVHYRLTGWKVLGIGDASGMFPVDSRGKCFDSADLEIFDTLPACRDLPWKLGDILPKVLTAGQDAGVLTQEGAGLLDETGALEAGIPLCPPEGDAGTGMVSTNTVAAKMCCISAGTSIFANIVLEKPLAKIHRQIDIVATPDGAPVAMAHANNCTSDVNAWVNLFGEFARAAGLEMDSQQLYTLLYRKALEGAPDCGGVLSYGYLSGENMLDLDEGRPLFMRLPDAKFNLGNFMRAHLYASIATLKLGMDILTEEENVRIDLLQGNGGFFKTEGVGQSLMADGLNVPVCVMQTAGEGGAWGMALLAAYMRQKAPGQSLADYLQNRVFDNRSGSVVSPTEEGVRGFRSYMERFCACLPVESHAVECLK